MSRRWEPRCRHYTELCNRSSSSSSIGRAAVVTPHNPAAFEDYWEDASVSLGSCHGWEMPVNPFSTSATEEYKDRKTMEDMGGPHQVMSSDKACSASQVNEHMACLRRPRSFPPPMSSCVTLSIKEGGRFVLKELDPRPQGFLRAERENGRLRLHLIQHDELDDEDEDSSCYDCEPPPPPPAIDSEDNLSDQEKKQTGHEAPDEEGIRNNGNDVVEMGETLDLDEGMCKSHVCGVEHTEVGLSASEEMLHTPDADNAGIDCSTLERHVMKHIAAESSSSSSSKQADVFQCQQQEPFWCVDVSNDAVCAGLNPWSPRQMLLHQSLARMSSTLGLAVS